MEKEYEVEVIFRQRALYHVRAPDREEAERRAVERWQEGGPSEVPGYDWCELQAVHASDAPAPEQRKLDAELVLRFLHERERLLMRLGGDLFSPSMNDTISADRVAADLGWSRPGGGGPDVVRATLALESLCQNRRVVCFQRPRVRTRERGEIRLYCTPEYLELLSADLDEVESQAV